MELYYFLRITESVGTVRNFVLIVYISSKQTKNRSHNIEEYFFQFVNE